MARIRLRIGMMLVAGLAVVGNTGCWPVAPFLIATPVQPWTTQRIEEKFNNVNDHRTPIMPPVRDGFPAPLCEDPPSDREVLRSLPKRPRGVPFIYEEFHDDIVIVKNRMVDKIDPPRFFPLVGPAQLHHCHWECVVYYNELIQSAEPYPVQIKKPRRQVVYIDKDHLHLYVGPNADAQKEMLLEMTKY